MKQRKTGGILCAMPSVGANCIHRLIWVWLVGWYAQTCKILLVIVCLSLYMIVFNYLCSHEI